MMPKRLSFLRDYICSKIKESKNGSVPPLLLKGASGVGKSWLLKEIEDEINKNDKLIGISIPLVLNANNLVSKISQLASVKEKELKSKKGDAKKNVSFVILLEGIDSLFNVSKDFRSKNKVFGKSAEYSHQIQHASELRSYLIENSRKISIIASSSENTQFIEDPDLPFYNFFNLIEVNSLNEIESLEYINEKIGKNRKALEIIDDLNKMDQHWPLHLTEGLISYINLFTGTALEVTTQKISTKETLNDFLVHYFNKIDPLVVKTIDNMSYSEKGLVDFICTLPFTFEARQINYPGINLSRSLSSLVNKQILIPAPDRPNSFQFKSHVFRSWIRFNKRLDIFDITKSY